jgi:hypothetical protein
MAETETTTLTFPISKPLEIGGRKILDAAVDIRISADPRTMAALAADAPLDLERDPVRLALASGSRSVDFIGRTGTVSFSSASDTRAGLGVYARSSDMLNDLAGLSGEGDQRISFDKLAFADVAAARYFALHWDCSAKGSLALGPGSKMPADLQGSRSRRFSVIRAYAVNPPARTAIENLFGKSWMLPNQVHSIDDLQPGTWILSEVAGSFSANLGVNLGFDYNWIRSVGTGAGEVFEGDIGLKIRAGVTAAFGVAASGRFLLMVGRDSLKPENKTIRVRLHRLDQRGRHPAFNATLKINPVRKALQPEQLDDFIAAILGLHGLQILEEVRRWTVPGRSKGAVAAAFLADYASFQLGEEFEGNFEKVRRITVDFFKKWDTLPAEAAGALWDAVRMNRDTIKVFIRHIEKLADPEKSDRELKSLMSDVHLASRPIGRWLLGVAGKRILGVLIHPPEAATIRKAARTVLDIINGRMLDALKAFVENKAGFPAVRKAIAENDFESLTALARKKLAQFLDRNGPLNAEDTGKIRRTVDRLLRRGEDLYRAGIEALDHSYRISFDYACSKSTMQTALLDISFDFEANPDLGPAFEKALSGDFSAVLAAPGQPALKGIACNDAVLTHRIQRQAHVRINLPHLTSETMQRASSLATYRFSGAEGDIRMYALDAEDAVLQSGEFESTLSVCMNFASGAKSEIRRYGKNSPGATVDYRFVQAIPALRTIQLERLMNPISKFYFRGEFSAAGGKDKPSVRTWASSLTQDAGGLQSGGDGLIGNSLIALEVSLPGDVLLRWLEAPGHRESPVYMEMSRRFQSVLRRFVPLLYFQDAKKYADLDVARPLLLYASLPVTTSVAVGKGTLRLNTDRDLYWNWPDAGGDRRMLIACDLTSAKLARTLEEVAGMLSSVPGLRSYTRYYDPRTEPGDILSSADANPGRFLMEGLLYAEASIIESAVKTARGIAQLRAETAYPGNAIQTLARFGEALTRIFNTRFTTLFHRDDPAGRHTLRNLGLMAFAEITAALGPQPDVQPTASFEITVLKNGRAFPPKGFPDRVTPAAGSVNLRRRILKIGAATAFPNPPAAGLR